MIHARIYKNSGVGTPVDYSSHVADVTAGTTWTTPAVAAPSDTTWALRFYDSVTGIEEQNTVATARVVVDAGGHDITAVPPAPTGVSASPMPAGGARVRWALSLLPGQPAPTGFHVYLGTPTPSTVTPVATLPFFRGRVRYSTGPQEGVGGADITGLSDGVTYQVYVRSYNAVGEEKNTNAATFVARVTPPAPVDPVSASAVP